MANGDISWITGFIWGIADDVLRDLYVRGKYRDVILPMTVLRRLDAVLEDTKQEVLERKAFLDENGVVDQDAALRDAAGQAFYNISPFSLRDLRHRTNQVQLRDDFIAWLDGFSPNVQDIIENFEFRNQVPRLSKADALGTLIEKFTHPDLNLSPRPVLNPDGTVRIPGLDNHAMGTIFEELVRRFNEENNEEAGEHWTPRDAIRLMANLIFRPIADDIKSGTYLLYDPAIGTGGMLTVAEETLTELAAAAGKKVVTHMYGQEINAETYAICKADLLLKGEGEEADNIVGGPEYSTIANDAFRSLKFDFMLSNPPYGKSWKTDLERLGGKKDLADPRFIVEHDGDPQFSLVPRSSDGQLLFLVNMLHKMRHDTELGSRIASVHNGSSLFTGDAGSGESNIRRWIIENDWLEAIVQMPENMFYNTGISTYIWVLTNRKPEHRKGKVQLIDASRWFSPLRRNLGQKSREFSEADIERITKLYLAFEETEESKIFNNEDFGYRKVTVDRPLRLRSQLSRKNVEALRFASGDEELRSELYDHIGEGLFDDFQSVAKAAEEWITLVTSEDEDGNPGRKISDAQKKRLLKAATWQRDAKLLEIGRKLRDKLGEDIFDDHNEFRAAVDDALKSLGEKLSAADKKALYRVVSWVDEEAPPVIKKVLPKGTQPDRLNGRFEIEIAGETRVVEFEHDPDLRDFERIPLTEPGGIAGFIEREVWTYTPDAWVSDGDGTVGYEISFTRTFYRPARLRMLEEIRDDIVKLEAERRLLVHRLMSLLEEEKQVIRSSAVTGHIGNGRQMVDSGLGWLGTIPDGWKLRRLKTLLKERNIRGFEDEPLLAATQAHGVIRKDDYAQRTVVAEKDLHLLKLVEVGDFVISLRSFEGGIEYSRARGIISPAYTVLSCADPALRSYLRWLFKSKPFIELLRLNVTGIREGQNIDYSRLSRERVPVPPEGDQRQIARYLDSATAEIEKAVVAEHRLMSLLEEEKQAMISAALGISSGLSPQGLAPFRDANGLSQPVRLKNLLTEVAKRSATGQGQLFSLRKGIGLVATGSVYGKEVAPEQLVGYKRVEAGQLVMNRMRASTGLFGVAPSDGLVSPDYAVYRVSPQVDPEFLVAVLRLPQFGAVIRANSKGLGTGASGFMRVYSEQLGQLTVPVPPLAEQRRIVAEITENGRRIDQAIDFHERQIALLDEYRARLVADVVTGKLDVRELADDLPELEVTESSLLASREGSQLEDVV